MFSVVLWVAQQQILNPRVTYVDPKKLPKPYSKKSIIKIPKITWPEKDDFLKVPPGFTVSRFASNLKSPRWMLVLPNADVLVTECYQNKIVLLRDADGDGRAEKQIEFITGLNMPFGLALQGEYLYVANTDSVVRFKIKLGESKPIGEREVIVAGVPSRGFHQHWTRNILFEPDGKHFLLTVGSETNRGPEAPVRALIWRYTADGKSREPYATGLRNPVGLTYRPGTNELWTTVVERDYMGDDVVPDFLAKVQKGDFFGWPWFYIGNNRDPKAKNPPRTHSPVRVPEVLFTAHSVPLGMVFCNSKQFPADYQGDLFVALRGSTNRKIMSGYVVVRISFKSGKPDPHYSELISGWIPNRNERLVFGRPVGLTFWTDGSLLIADEGGNKIWRMKAVKD